MEWFERFKRTLIGKSILMVVASAVGGVMGAGLPLTVSIVTSSEVAASKSVVIPLTIIFASAMAVCVADEVFGNERPKGYLYRWDGD